MTSPKRFHMHGHTYTHPHPHRHTHHTHTRARTGCDLRSARPRRTLSRDSPTTRGPRSRPVMAPRAGAPVSLIHCSLPSLSADDEPLQHLLRRLRHPRRVRSSFTLVSNRGGSLGSWETSFTHQTIRKLAETFREASKQEFKAALTEALVPFHARAQAHARATPDSWQRK